jgi:methionyl-tRNA synthetase
VQSERKGYVPCDHQYLNFRGGKFSKSRGGAVDVPYFLSKYDPDALHFYLTAVAPETRDTELAWEDFVERNNPVPSASEGNELVATARLSVRPSSRRGLAPKPGAPFAGMANCMLSFAYKRFDGQVPEPGDPSSSSPRPGSGRAGQGLGGEDRALLAKVEAGFETVGDLYNACQFRAALNAALALAREANGYLDSKAPWFQIKEDPEGVATTVYVILPVVDNLSTILAPILPHTA